MPNIRDIAEEIVRREGGFVNDPDDPGGATKYGVTIHTLRSLGLDLTGDNKITVADVKQLTQKQAVDIFIDHYFFGPKIDHLPEQLRPSVFDMYVNSGSNAVRILQRLLNDLGHLLIVDGVIGPQTMRATHQSYGQDPKEFLDAYGIARRNYYYRIADLRPASRKFARASNGGKGGWIKRAEEFISARYHLSDQEHFQRTSAWD